MKLDKIFLHKVGKIGPGKNRILSSASYFRSLIFFSLLRSCVSVFTPN